ncbi:MAG: ribonuclease E activity regulator RraA [Candidatus Latescibacterota bacterium]|nr:ribonuclease E activity regulator RraA [Candidatus Latescibacterota bacterium]
MSALEQDFKTADLSDEHKDVVSIAEPLFHNYGGRACFGGAIVALKVFEDNSLVRELVQEDGRGRVIIVDGGGSLRYSLVGDLVAQSAADHDWAGMLIYGAVRDSRDLADIPVGVQALGTIPRRSIRRNEGQRGLPVTFGGVTFSPGEFVYADEDGVIVAPHNLLG